MFTVFSNAPVVLVSEAKNALQVSGPKTTSEIPQNTTTVPSPASSIVQRRSATTAIGMAMASCGLMLKSPSATADAAGRK